MTEEQMYNEVVEDNFEAFMESYELDPEGSIVDMLFELFAAGFDAAVEEIEEDDDDE
jgi:hypothetical protein